MGDTAGPQVLVFRVGPTLFAEGRAGMVLTLPLLDREVSREPVPQSQPRVFTQFPTVLLVVVCTRNA